DQVREDSGNENKKKRDCRQKKSRSGHVRMRDREHYKRPSSQQRSRVPEVTSSSPYHISHESDGQDQRQGGTGSRNSDRHLLVDRWKSERAPGGTPELCMAHALPKRMCVEEVDREQQHRSHHARGQPDYSGRPLPH